MFTCDSELTLQLAAIRSALALVHEAVIVVVEETIRSQNLINVNAIVTGCILALGRTIGH